MWRVNCMSVKLRRSHSASCRGSMLARCPAQAGSGPSSFGGEEEGERKRGSGEAGSRDTGQPRVTWGSAVTDSLRNRALLRLPRTLENVAFSKKVTTCFYVLQPGLLSPRTTPRQTCPTHWEEDARYLVITLSSRLRRGQKWSLYQQQQGDAAGTECAQFCWSRDFLRAT